MKKILSILSVIITLTSFVSCNGDMHDEDESLRKYVVFSVQEKTLTAPEGTLFAENFAAYNIVGTYGEYNFTSIKITVDGFSPSLIELFDANNNSIYKKTNGETLAFALEYELKIKIDNNSIFPTDKWNNIKYTK